MTKTGVLFVNSSECMSHICMKTIDLKTYLGFGQLVFLLQLVLGSQLDPVLSETEGHRWSPHLGFSNPLWLVLKLLGLGTN